MFIEDADEAITVSGLNEVGHLVSYHVFEKVFGLFDQLGVEADMSLSVVAASPLGLHPLQEIAANLDSELSLPLLDDRRDRLVKKPFVPLMDKADL
jgi:hypothetical protein